MKCPACQSDNREGVRFCEECGAKFEIECPTCMALIPLGKKFCGACGNKIAEPEKPADIEYDQPLTYTPKFLADKILTNRSSLEGERKLVTVLFADVANYTSMSENLDPEDVHQIMDSCFQILMDEIHKYEGSVNQFTGDGVMALFGAPIAHEDHAQRACHAALTIQKALKTFADALKKRKDIEFRMRIGLNSGPVVVGTIGDDLRMDYTAIGDVTNLAARMESMAEPGTILVSNATYKLVKDYFVFDSIGELELKGKEKPQIAYRLIKTSEVDTRFEASVLKGLTQFVGRKNSFRALRESYDRMLSGSGQVVGVVGEAGVGKSRLLLEFVKQLPKGEVTYLQGRCLHYGSGMVYLPILDMLHSYFEIKEGDSELSIKKKISYKISQLDNRLSEILPSFQELFSVKVDDEKYIQLDPGHKKMRTFEAIRDLFLLESQRRPLVLAVEDLHWIDKTSEACIGYLIDWLAKARILLILLYRLEYTHQWGSRSHYKKIGLTQLGPDSSRLLVQAILRHSKVPAEIRELVLSRAGGNPLFIEELTQNLIENGTIVRKDNQYLFTRDVSDIQVPNTVQGIIAARIDRIDESMKHVIQMASVIGREFAFRILQNIIEMKEDLKSDLLNLQGLELISQKKLFPELEYIFKHALTQEVAYNSLLKKQRKKLHEKIGLAIESLYPERLEEYYELLAYHYGEGGNAEKAAIYLELAIQKAVSVNAMEEAMSHFNRAMKFLDDLPDNEDRDRRQISLLMNIAFAFFQLYQYPEYREILTIYKPVAERLVDRELSCSYWAHIGHCQWWLGDSTRGLQSLEKAAKICIACENYEEACYVYLQMQWLHKSQARYDEVFSLHEQSLRMMERAFHLRYYIWTESATAWSYAYIGQWDKAVEAGNRALSVAQDYSDKSMICFASLALSVAHTIQGRLEPALRYSELGVSSAPTPVDKAWSSLALAWALCRSSRTDQGIQILSQILPQMRGRGTLPEIICITALGEGYWLAGNDDKAKSILESSIEHSQRVGYKWFYGWAHRILGEIHQKIEPSLAENHFKTSMNVLRHINAENEFALSCAAYGRFHAEKGNQAKAKSYLTEAMEIFERLRNPNELDKAKNDLAGFS
jgi:class 3 adenylate cyclase/tetratricopeptide (TPR) repeat protein